MKTYNINELLDKKKDLEKQLTEQSAVHKDALTYEKETYTDHTNKDRVKVIEQRPKITLNEYATKFNTILDELSIVTIAIQKHNADNVVELLQQRDAARKRINYLELIKVFLPKDNKHKRGVSREKDGVILESIEVKSEPMFLVDEVEKQYNEAASQERKFNTEIQKINLNAKVKLE